MRVRFTGFEADYAPTGVLRLYCDERGYKHGIEFVDIRGANERYYHGGKSPLLLSAMECQNVTRHKLYSAGAIRHDLFDAWFKKKSSNDEAAEHSRHWALQNRTGLSQPSPEGKLVLDRIDRHRQSGGKVACLYGTVPFDFGCPSLDQGPAHFDRRDWYNHTVATLADTDVLLLIKPHPDEARFEQVGFPNQFFVELLDQPLPCNVVILGHHWLNNAELTPVIDFGITWRGSIASELALMRVPVVVCNANLPTGHSLAFPAPKDREDYEDLLRHPERIVLTDELVRRAALVFEFYRSEVMIPYPFGWIPHKKGKAGTPVLSEKAIQNYIKRGHPSVDEICKRIISD
jgi:hypothetical protein